MLFVLAVVLAESFVGVVGYGGLAFEEGCWEMLEVERGGPTGFLVTILASCVGCLQCLRMQRSAYEALADSK